MLRKPRLKVFRGDRLKEIREKREMSQDDLADLLEFGPSQMNKYEKGKQDPSAEILKRMAIALQVSTDWLLGLTRDPGESFQAEDLTPQERKLITRFRNADFEGFMRVASEGSEKKKDDDPG